MNSNYHKLEEPKTTNGGKLTMVQSLSPEQTRNRTFKQQIDKQRRMPMTSIHNNRNTDVTGGQDYKPLEDKLVASTGNDNQLHGDQ